jgi:hypothetical protein
MLGRGITAGLQVADPARDRTFSLGRHDMASHRSSDRTSAPMSGVDCNSILSFLREVRIPDSLSDLYAMPLI